MKLLLLLSALVAGTFAMDMPQRFQMALASFSVEDHLPQHEPPQMVQSRYKAFAEFAKEVDRVNADDRIPFTSAINFLSILTEAEKAAYTGLNVTGHENENLSAFEEERLVARQLPASRDFSAKIGGIKNQGSCGSCWTFAATAALEGEMYFKNSKGGVSLSEQEYMECSTSRDGCQGGWMADCYSYTRRSGRIAPTSAAPYKGRDARSCNYGGKANAMTIAGVKLGGSSGNLPISRGDNNLLKYASAHIVSVAIKVTNTFMTYKNGIFKDPTCQTQPNHAVAVVGYGGKDGAKFWKVRNSWGTRWGDAGYILMSRDVNNICMISNYAHIPNVQCSSAANCNPADPNDGSDGGEDDSDDGSDDGEDDQDDGSDGDDEQKMCKTRISLNAKCLKSEKQAKRSCTNAGNPNCAIVRMQNKCFYTEVDGENSKKYIDIMLPCKDDDGSDGGSDEECDSAAGLVYCNDCQCCMHEHMCKNPAV